MKRIQFAVFVFMLLITACAGNNEKSATDSAVNTASVNNNDVIVSYMRLKDALVDSDETGARKHAGELLNAAENAGMAQDVLGILGEMQANEDLEAIRDGFDPLSREMYSWATSIDLGDQTLYWQYCPMAKNNTGASWLSLESEILNPYFGDQMLTCGVVEEEIN